MTKPDSLVILAHPKPMRRHTKHVVPAEFEYIIRLPGAGGPTPGLHLELKFDDGATQRIIFPLGRSLEKLVQGSRMAASMIEPQPKADLTAELLAALEELLASHESDISSDYGGTTLYASLMAKLQPTRDLIIRAHAQKEG